MPRRQSSKYLEFLLAQVKGRRVLPDQHASVVALFGTIDDRIERVSKVSNPKVDRVKSISIQMRTHRHTSFPSHKCKTQKKQKRTGVKSENKGPVGCDCDGWSCCRNVGGSLALLAAEGAEGEEGGRISLLPAGGGGGWKKPEASPAHDARRSSASSRARPRRCCCGGGMAVGGWVALLVLGCVRFWLV